MRSGKNDFESAYHKINNPGGNKKFRQILESEGFEKNGILIMNDIKYISAGRIKKETVKIKDDILFEIQKYSIERMFPDIYRKYDSMINSNMAKIEKQKEEIVKLKNEVNNYKIREKFIREKFKK